MSETIEERLENMSPIGVDQDGNILVKHEDWFWLQELAQESEDAQYALSETLRQKRKYNARILKENKRFRVAMLEALRKCKWNNNESALILEKALEVLK